MNSNLHQSEEHKKFARKLVARNIGQSGRRNGFYQEEKRNLEIVLFAIHYLIQGVAKKLVRVNAHENRRYNNADDGIKKTVPKPSNV